MTDGFMPEHAGNRRGTAAVHGVQVGAADRGQGDLHQHLAGLKFIGQAAPASAKGRPGPWKS